MYIPTSNETHGGINDRCDLQFVKINVFDKPLFNSVVNIYKNEFSSNIRLSIHCYKKLHTYNKYKTIGAIKDKSTVGFVSLLYFENAPLVHIDYIAIDKKYQGMGFAKSIMSHILNMLRHKNVSLECDEKLEKFYVKFGFETCNVPYQFKDHPMLIMIKPMKSICNSIYRNALAKILVNILLHRNMYFEYGIFISNVINEIHILHYPEAKLDQCINIHRKNFSMKRDIWQQKLK